MTLDIRRKIVSLPALKQRVKRSRQQGQKIAFTNGCFDILHYGHVMYLQKAKKRGRVLVVGLNSDASVKKIKGSGRPVNRQDHRAAVLAALGCVDYVTLFEEETPEKLIAAVRPDILIKGADYKNQKVVGSDIVKANGGKVELIEYIPGVSTTGVIGKINKRGKPKTKRTLKGR